MSRVAKQPISIPNLVNVEIGSQSIKITGPLGELSSQLPPQIELILENGLLKVTALAEDKQTRAQSGTLRAILCNQVRGVSEGFTATLILVKVGANAKVEGDNLVLKIGYSNPKRYSIPRGVSVTTTSPTELVIKGIDIQQVYQVAAEIIKIRPPEVYKGTGILMKGQRVLLKTAKKN